MKPTIAPSILASDFANLQSEIGMINRSEADWIHVDVMDGVFVPNISMGLPVLESVKRHARKPLDVHLMIVQPEHLVEAFRKAGADIITVHAEACPHLHRNIQQIKGLQAEVGVALNPHTPVQVLENVIQDNDLICVMSVNPGFGGQKFIEKTFDKIRALRQMIQASQSKALIEIDGGVNLDNAQPLLDAGSDVLVAGNCVFASKNPEETIQKLKGLRTWQRI